VSQAKFVIALAVLVIFVVLVVRRKRLAPFTRSFSQTESVIESFLHELETENERWIETVRGMQRAWKETAERYENRITALEERVAELEARLQKKGESPVDSAAQVPAILVSERYQRILALHAQGLSTEQIARDLGVGKGVVQLVLSLAEQK
jgi:ATP/maltotriose-dependent transcriptional regulator MalT